MHIWAALIALTGLKFYFLSENKIVTVIVLELEPKLSAFQPSSLCIVSTKKDPSQRCKFS